MRTNITALSLVLFLAPGATTASASTITYSFTGTADSVDPFIVGTFEVGDTLSGTFEFDPLPRPGGCRELVRCYPSPLQLFSANVGSYEFTGTVAVAISSATWGVFAAPTDPQEIVHTDLVGPTVNGLPPRLFSISLLGPSEPLDYLQIVQPVFADYAERRFELMFDEVRNEEGFIVFPLVRGTLTSLAPTAVPEPATALLLLAGVLPYMRQRRCARRGARGRRSTVSTVSRA